MALAASFGAARTNIETNLGRVYYAGRPSIRTRCCLGSKEVQKCRKLIPPIAEFLMDPPVRVHVQRIRTCKYTNVRMYGTAPYGVALLSRICTRARTCTLYTHDVAPPANRSGLRRRSTKVRTHAQGLIVVESSRIPAELPLPGSNGLVQNTGKGGSFIDVSRCKTSSVHPSSQLATATPSLKGRLGSTPLAVFVLENLKSAQVHGVRACVHLPFFFYSARM